MIRKINKYIYRERERDYANLKKVTTQCCSFGVQDQEARHYINLVETASSYICMSIDYLLPTCPPIIYHMHLSKMIIQDILKAIERSDMNQSFRSKITLFWL